MAAIPAACRPVTNDGSRAPALLAPELKDLIGVARSILPVVDTVVTTCGINPEGPYCIGPQFRAEGLDILVELVLPPADATRDEGATVAEEVRALVRVAQGLLALWLGAEDPDWTDFSMRTVSLGPQFSRCPRRRVRRLASRRIRSKDTADR